MKKIDFKQWLPYIGAVLIFLIITLVYFSPLLEGKRIHQSDIVQFTGMSKEIADFREKTGSEPLWTNSMFGGMPAYQISVIYKGNLLGYLDKILSLGLPHPASTVFLYFIGFFILLLVLKVNPWLSIAGAVAFAFSSYFFIILDVGHNSKAHAIAYMAPVLAGIILTLRRKYLWGGILTAIFLSLEIKANHPQITYYLVIIVLILGLFELIYAIREKRFASFAGAVGILVIAASFAVFTNIATLWATWEYGKHTIRGKSELTHDLENKTSGLDKDYATQWSYGVGETMTLLIPNFYGGASASKISDNSAIVKALKKNNVPQNRINKFTKYPLPLLYWGDQPSVAGPVYVGAIVFFLFILGLIIVKGPLKWWLLTVTVLSILLSWGHNFMAFTDFFMEYIPGYNKFRGVSMSLVIAEFAMPLLALLALKILFDQQVEQKKLFRSLKIATGIAGGLTLLFILLPGLFLSFSGPNDATIQQQFQFPDWMMQAIRDERARLVRMDSLRSFAFILMTAATLWALLFSKLKTSYVYIMLGLLILFDMFMISKRYLNNDSFTEKTKVENPFTPTAADQQILQDKDPDFRVLNLSVNTFNDASTSYFHKSIGGYHGAKLRRYQELIENQISKSNMSVLNMLNTKYFIIAGEDRTPVAQRNFDALGHAWFVEDVKLVDNADQEMEAITHFHPADTVIMDKRFENELNTYTTGRDSLAFIRLISYAPNDLNYEYKTEKNGLAVFSEIYYPKGWNAYVDGEPTPHFRANYVLRAMVLPAGSHQVEFKFEPKVYLVGEKISLISSITLLVLIIVLGLLEARKAWKAAG
ncbi:MAG: YfhO family protein [Bacteroidales bacterium]|nr:YfhO family protein [Bacteroidales bacterium]